jgi:hypothetical protein
MGKLPKSRLSRRFALTRSHGSVGALEYDIEVGRVGTWLRLPLDSIAS